MERGVKWASRTCDLQQVFGSTLELKWDQPPGLYDQEPLEVQLLHPWSTEIRITVGGRKGLNSSHHKEV